jgi:hypothetical protein
VAGWCKAEIGAPVTIITLPDRSGMSFVDHLALGGQFALYMDITIPMVNDEVAATVYER